MDVNSIIMMLAAKFPWVLLVASALGALVVVGAAVVALTPSKSDDEKYAALMEKPIIGPILKALASFSPIQKK